MSNKEMDIEVKYRGAEKSGGEDKYRHCEECLNYLPAEDGIRGGKWGYCKIRRRGDKRSGRSRACKRFWGE